MVPPLLCQDSDGVRTITLNRPDRLNAIDLDIIDQLGAAIQEAQREDHVRVILLRGSGRSFCAGDDVIAQSKTCAAGEAALRDQLSRLQNISEMLVLGDRLVVVAIHGWAVGAGFSWVLNADFRLWGEGAGGFLPEIGFGTFVTGGATFLLPRLLPRKAHEMLFLASKLRSSEAMALGLAHSVHPDDQLHGYAEATARQLAALPALAARRMKRALASVKRDAFRNALNEEIEACVATTLDPETLTRMRASIAKA